MKKFQVKTDQWSDDVAAQADLSLDNFVGFVRLRLIYAFTCASTKQPAIGLDICSIVWWLPEASLLNTGWNCN